MIARPAPSALNGAEGVRFGANAEAPFCKLPRETDMNTTRTYASDVAFTPTVKAIQSRKGLTRGLCADGGERLMGNAHHP